MKIIYTVIRHIIFSFFFLLAMAPFSSANDGAFFAAGNHLIPIEEADIRVKKEILSINRISPEEVEVLVYYEFENPGNDPKTLIVGFEAIAPHGDASFMPVDGKHPYMSAFTVEVNKTILPYQVAVVTDSVYYKNKKMDALNAEQISKRTDDGFADFFYVYYFEATFEPGLNMVKHSYTCKLSGGIVYNYYFDYVLTAANRWGNKQIDDFTLIIRMGDFQDFQIPATFFQNSNDWIITGTGKASDQKNIPDFAYDGEFEAGDAARFYIRKGDVIYKKTNFSPQGELHLISFKQFHAPVFDCKEQSKLPLTAELHYESAADPGSQKILRNLPFAKRGYLFKNKELADYYSSQPWYIPDPSYQSKMSDLTEAEQEWVARWDD